MSAIPPIRLDIQPAKMGIDIQRGQWDIRQPQPTMEMHTTPTTIEMSSPQGEIHIDQSRAWDALGIGSNITFMNRIYSQSKDIALQGIASIVAKGNRLAAIEKGGNPIADMAAERAFEPSSMNYLGEASYDNVDLDYTPHKVEIEVNPGHVSIEVTPHFPEISYTPGKVSFYVQQYPKAEMIPPEIDTKV
ncbi:hypothetical protein A8709_20620 [Paenibacillus pectinilyticus]|uniref:Uncharacterized protein n=1 Tax=Paenibacillus pectinilyticus TaxID=512399 RepID=A0A1C0ZYD9_9BACL|nr:DUF6470 family protein [Paenibacillus pectinilyticus]OCT13151.1 hypothetical protein A8709_20620 [Paenibacillus pectinilyticus]